MNHPCIQAFKKLLTNNISDKRFLAVALTLPAESEIAQHVNPWDPSAVRGARDYVESSISNALYSEFLRIYQQENQVSISDSASRKLKNVCLGYLLKTSPTVSSDALKLCQTQFDTSKNMTDQYGALVAINDVPSHTRELLLKSFFDQWKDDSLVLMKWFAVQAMSQQISVEKLTELMQLPQFSLQSPNLVYSLIGGFAMNNPKQFHSLSGEGYKFLADNVIAIDNFNPQVSSRMAKAFAVGSRLDATRQEMIKTQLSRILQTHKPSSDLFEVLNSILTSS